jgi:lipopolysaccharide export system protein LptA
MNFCSWLLLLLLVVPPVFAEETQSPAEGPIEVTSQRMESDQQAGKVLFVGEVVGKRGSMTIYAEQLALYFVEEDGQRNLDRIEAAGKVRVVDGERVATAERLDYLQASEKMTLSGNAEVHQGGNLVKGDEIEIFVREDRSLVKSDKGGRVRAIFTPAKELK